MYSPEHVILLHGIFRTSRHLRPLARFLADEGYVVHNLDYPSTRHPFETLVKLADQTIAALPLDKGTVHYIGYSMGGLLVRALLARRKPENLGYVVQLAPPNHGSEVTDVLKRFWLFRTLYGPAGVQLGVGLPALCPLFAPVDYALGVVAGNLSLDPVCYRMFSGANDGKVSVESTKLAGMRDHIIVPACHTFFPSSRTVQEQAFHFLRYGAFDHSRDRR